MENCYSLLVLVSLSCYVCSVQFDDDAANLGQTKQSEVAGFFPSNSEPDERYSELSGIKYVDPSISYDDGTSSNNRKQLNFNGNLNRQTPAGGIQYYQQQNPYRPTINSPGGVMMIRKRPMKIPYQYAGVPSNYYNSYSSSDLSNPLYQNYANHYQYPTATGPATAASSSPYPDYYNPTRYPSPTSANLNGQQQLLHQASLQYPNYYTNNYANQFGYQRPSSIYGNNGDGVGGGGINGISSFFNNIRESNGPLGQISQVGGQFGKALEDISANDDLQCVPKILCQMVRSSRRPNQLPSFMNVPGLSAIISALPSSSPLMNFGRAALLGLSAGGECDAAYPKCPRSEEQMLHYLNNHRGGFFRFFNGGNSFGDDNYLQQQQQQQQQLNPQFNQQQGDTGASQGLNLLALQALADTLNQGNGFNLNNLFSSASNQRPVAQSYPGLQADQSQSGGFFGMFKPSALSDIVSNLLTGVVGNRFSRRLSKRSLPDDNVEEGRHRIEKRIINLKESDARLEQNFFEASSNDQQLNTLYSVEAPFTFSNENRILNAQHSDPGFTLKFPNENVVQPQEIPLSEINQGNFISPSDIARRLKMLFPEATGHLRFDNDQFNRELLRALVNDRIGKILTGVQQRPINNNYDINRYQGQNYNNQNTNQRYPAQNYAGVVSSNYNSNNINSNQYNRGQQQQQSSGNNADRSHIVYITNSRGQLEYTLNELTGEKKRS